MRLIDADIFKQQVAVATIKMNLLPEKTVALMELIDEQPTVSSSGKLNDWIPVSDRLPGKDGDCWITYIGVKYGGIHVSKERFYTSVPDYWDRKPYKILAWQPYYEPEPYKPEPKEDTI